MPHSIRAVVAGALLLCGSVFGAESAGHWLDVPFVAQQKDGCGSAVIAMVMQYWQKSGQAAPSQAAEYARIDQALLSRQTHGVYASAMTRYFDENGYRAFAFSGQMSDVKQHIDQGRPLIAALQPGAKLPLHYVVIAGYDLDAHVILLNDPAQRKLLKEDLAQFEQEWKATDHWTLLAVPGSSSRR